MQKEYTVSINEINRRKKAFTTLLASLFISINVSSFDFIQVKPEIAIPSMIILALSFIYLRIIFSKSSKKYSLMKIKLTNNSLVRIYHNSTENYLSANISKVCIKRTVKDLIREMKIEILKNNTIYINGINNFDEFKTDLINVCKKNILISNIREPIDYDHPFFYVIFGTIFGIILTILIRLVTLMRKEYIKYFQCSIGCFVFLVGAYWLITKPISGRYGNKKIIVDYLISFIMISIGIFIPVNSNVFY